MVSTRSQNSSGAASAAPAADPNRIVAIVTGANSCVCSTTTLTPSGFGLGLCHALLANLSTVGPVPAAVAQATALAPSLRPALDEGAALSSATIGSPHPALTLVLAVRSESNAKEARSLILARHAAELEARRAAGVPVPEGWEEGLRVEYELVDLDQVGGAKGVLSFAKRVKGRYPHVTSLFLNAGYAAITQVVIPRFVWSMLTDGPLYALHHPRYNVEEVGARSADGERGRVWGINVLAPYILSKELAPALRASPKSLPYDPRIVYTSSIEAEAEGLNPSPLDDIELLTYESSYRASKYMGDLVVTQLDAELGAGDRPIRVISAEPGCVATNIAVSGLGAWQWLVQLKWACYWLSFYLAYLFGSPHHPVWASDGAAPMLYAALVGSAYLLPAAKLPGPKVHVVARRFRSPGVKYGEVDEWEAHGDVAAAVAKHCETIRRQWHKRGE
ncbi:3-keto-steroid reductase [Vanrija albida]|uniref:3-keto-steroid reductase n=1 Tax=Vanrija albida TaxID=181172 RepID=A0ABR3Q536_9TREE